MTKTRFDNSLTIFVLTILDIIGLDAINTGSVLRDATGRLAFISRNKISNEDKNRATIAATERLGGYCRSGRVILEWDQPGISSLLGTARGYRESIEVGANALDIHVLDQRIVGQDWLLAPAPSREAQEAKRYVFASIKGGVGRTTAMAVAAADMAREGKKVLVVDLDLEAPGIGNMLLSPEELPQFGMLDAFVENSLSGIDTDFLVDMIAASRFGMGRGLIDVVPAVGSIAESYPANVLSKISRGYLEDVNDSGEPVGFTKQTQQLIDSLSSMKQYDAILIDARAGLNESTAAAILGLGAQVLLFGEDTPQTFAGYRYLLAHLSRFPRDEADDWLDRIKMIHAKASADLQQQQAFRDRAHEIFQELIYKEEPLTEAQDTSVESQTEDVITLPEFSLDDKNAPHYAWTILRDTNYIEFNPLKAVSQLGQPLYERTYREFLDGLSGKESVSD